MRAVFFQARPGDVPAERSFRTCGEAVAWAESVASRRRQDCFVLILNFGELVPELHVIGMRTAGSPGSGWRNTLVRVSW